MTALPQYIHHRYERMHEIMLREPNKHALSLRRRVRGFVAALPGLRCRLRIARGMDKMMAEADVAACVAAIEELTAMAEREEQRAREGGEC